MSSAAVLRWEWRAFDGHTGRWRDALREAEPAGEPESSAEIYVLSRRSDANVKIRRQRIDVKTLLRTDQHGFELWEPVLDEGFPAAPAVIQRLFGYWNLPARTGGEAIGTIDQLVAALEPMSADLAVIPVRKSRHRYRLRECIAERATVITRGRTLETFAIEHPEPDVLLATLRGAGLAGEPNVNYVVALKGLVGWSAPAA